ncbi:MAG: hypothetical protein K0S97_2267 [Chloroflexota bacterium]|nr:hypothetical protein [Chloroflexota bacterium]
MRHGFSSIVRWPMVLVLVAATFVLPKPASAQELVTIIEVDFDRFGGLSATGGPQIAVSITCDATGIIGDLDIVVEQRGFFANTNLSLLDAPCTTAPTRYVIQLDRPTAPDGSFRPGVLEIVTATAIPGGEFGDGQKIILRKDPLL